MESVLMKFIFLSLVLMVIGTGFVYMHLMAGRVSFRNFCVCPLFVSM